MVKNHQHGAIGAVKHGSGRHLRDEAHDDADDKAHAKRCRLGHVHGKGSSAEAIADEAKLDAAMQRFAAVCARDSADLAGEELTIGDCRAFAECLTSPSCRLVVLDIKHIGFGPAAAELLAAAVKVNTSLTRLNIERNGLAISGGKAVGNALSANTSLTSLDMSLNDIAPEGGIAVAAALAHNATLTELTVRRCGLGPGGGKALGAALQTNTSLCELDVTQNDLGVEGGVAFGRALDVNTTLRTLNMRFNRIGFGLERATAFAEALGRNRTLTSLDMSQNELSELGGVAFAEALRRNATLTRLEVQRNELGPGGGAAIGASIAVNDGLVSVDVSVNELGAAGAAAFGDALARNSVLEELDVSHNEICAEGGAALAAGLARNQTLRELRIGRNRLGVRGGAALAAALCTHRALTVLRAPRNGLASSGVALADAVGACVALRELDLSDNELDDEASRALVEAVAAHPSLIDVDLSHNLLEHLQIACQLQLGQRADAPAGRRLRLSLEGNQLSSPPLGRGADADTLGAYVRQLVAEPAAVSRVRLMVVGFGGVGKTTFCGAATRADDELAQYHSSLTHCSTWEAATIGAWARGLRSQHEWAESAAAVLEAHAVRGPDLPSLLLREEAAEETRPSPTLEKMATDGGLDARQLRQLAIAIGSLLRKGYFSTVGAVKVEGALKLTTTGGAAGGGAGGAAGVTTVRECTLVDFAGQMEYLVSHQLLLSSMHTLCVLLQPSASFDDPTSRHHGSWRYWLQFLRALGERRTASLILGVSQIDKVPAAHADAAHAAACAEFASLNATVDGGLGDDGPLCLDYRSTAAAACLREARRRLSAAAEAVARDWWVPASYEKLASLVRAAGEEKRAARSLPLLGYSELRDTLRRTADDEGLLRMADDALLLQRGVEYLEAVGDVMSDRRLDCLLLDPVGWFAAFLAHFIRDDGNPPAEVVRGVVTLADVVAALRHEYTSPEEQVPEVMALVCRLELCVELSTLHHSTADGEGAYLFPCLLPAATSQELAQHWPTPATAADASAPAARALVIRGHRFRARDRFLPPGLFPTILARLARLPSHGPPTVHSSRLWNNAAVLRFRGDTRVLVAMDAAAATLDVVAAASEDGMLFVGAAKGQASVLRWLAHLIRQTLRTGYDQIAFDESWLCPSPVCHGLGAAADGGGVGVYRGSEFPLDVPQSDGAAATRHTCEEEGCWHFLGKGHAREPVGLRGDARQPVATCALCGAEPYFPLRAGGGFGWASKEDVALMRLGMSVVQPKLGFGAGGRAVP